MTFAYLMFPFFLSAQFKQMKALLQKEEIGEEENYIKLHERIRESSSTRVNKHKWMNKKK